MTKLERLEKATEDIEDPGERDDVKYIIAYAKRYDLSWDEAVNVVFGREPGSDPSEPPPGMERRYK